MSKRLWGLDWRAVLPWQLGDIVVEAVSHEAILPFMKAHYPSFFGMDEGHSLFLIDPMTEAKRRFFSEMDCFLFRDGDKTVGIGAGHPSDWTTYYFRTAAFLHEYRDRGLLTQFSDEVFPVLASLGVDRFELECSPANTAMMRVSMAQGAIVTGSTTSERWGQMLRFTKFLRAEPVDIHLRQFCAMPFKSSSFTKTRKTRGQP